MTTDTNTASTNTETKLSSAWAFIKAEGADLYAVSKPALKVAVQDVWSGTAHLGRKSVDGVFDVSAHALKEVATGGVSLVKTIWKTAGVLTLGSWVGVAGVTGYQQSQKPDRQTFDKEFVHALVRIPTDLAIEMRKSANNSEPESIAVPYQITPDGGLYFPNEQKKNTPQITPRVY